MVRFIIRSNTRKSNKEERIYIPIWLDLLFNVTDKEKQEKINLHSNMVRFIMTTSMLYSEK